MFAPLVKRLSTVKHVVTCFRSRLRSSILLGLIVISLLTVGVFAAAGSVPAPFTVAGQFLFSTGLLDQESVIWMTSLVDAESEDDVVVGLRWMKETSSWFPKWTLQLTAKPDILADNLGQLRDDAWEWIELNDVGWLFGADQTYQCRLAYDPAAQLLSYEIREQEDRVLANGTVELNTHVRLAPAAQAQVEQLYPYMTTYAVSNTFQSFGPPLLAQALDTALVDSSLGINALVHSSQFEAGGKPGVRLTWPRQKLPGQALLQVRQGDQLTLLATSNWSEEPQLLTLPTEKLPWGSSSIELIYQEGSQQWVINQHDFRYYQGVAHVGMQVVGRDDAGGLLLKASITTQSSDREYPLELTVDYTPSIETMQAETWTLQDTIVFPPGQSHLEAVYTIPVPPFSGNITLSVVASRPEKLIVAGGQMGFTLENALAFRATIQGSGLRAEQGQPALLRTGNPYPTIHLDKLLLGEQEGMLRVQLVGPHQKLLQEEAHQVAHGMELSLGFNGEVTEAGLYEIRLTLERTNLPNAYQTLHFRAVASDAEEEMAKQLAFLGQDGRLQYTPDYLGNQIPDFSYAGYMGGGVPLPTVPVKAIVEPGEGDDTRRIQTAINEVSALPQDANGFRGAVLLKKGTYEIGSSIQLSASGVVLRGEGDGEDGTVLIATGAGSRSLIQISGLGGLNIDTRRSWQITDLYVPVGARSFHVASAEGLNIGDLIVIRRYGNAAFISEIGMDQLPAVSGRNIVQWQPFHLDFERTITDISGDVVTIDAPLTNAIELQWGGGQVFLARDLRSEKIGVENLRAVSEYDDAVRCFNNGYFPCDENHASYLVSFSQVKNAWASNLTAVHFAHGAALVNGTAKSLTIQDIYSLAPVATLEGSRRYPFHVLGQLTLVQRAYTDNARHAYATNKQVTGPIVFLHTMSEIDHANSEPHRMWAVGGLYDNVVSQIAIQDRYTYGSGHGWAGANFVAWNTTGRLMVQKPPTAQNWVIGHIGQRHPGSFLPREQGYTYGAGSHVKPQSLYLQQLQDRLGKAAVVGIGYPDGPNSIVKMGDPRKIGVWRNTDIQEAVVPPIIASGGINLLPNPGLAGEEGEFPFGWEPYTKVADIGKDVFFTQEEDSWGVQVFSIDDRLRDKGYGIRSIPQPVQVGATYTASALVRTEDGGKGYVYVDFLDANGKRVQAKSATSTSRIWQPVTATLTAPEGAVSVMVVLYSDSTSMGKAFFDYAGLQIEY
ncbi:MAG TPA: hypothetical protein GXZ82_08025 [Firmicutes bacterium]|nr:hypothetical protein [Bacillota bacterium]